MSNFIEKVSAHLNNGDCISIFNDNGKLRIPNKKKDKFLWRKADVLSYKDSVEAFLKGLQHEGFGTGSILEFRTQNGTRTLHKSETVLNFNESSETKETPVNTKINNMEKPSTDNNPAPQGMGFVVQQHEIISLNVKAQQYDWVRDQLDKAKTDLLRLETELSQEKIKNFDLDRKLAMADDKAEMRVQKVELDRKSFLDTDTGKEIVQAAPALLGSLTALLGKGAQPGQAPQQGMATPQLTQEQLQIVSLIEDAPQEFEPILMRILKASKIPEFVTHIEGMLEEIEASNLMR
jgi:hypothetical protein